MGPAATRGNDSPDSYQGTPFRRAARDESKQFPCAAGPRLAKRSALKKRCSQSVKSHLAQEPKE